MMMMMIVMGLWQLWVSSATSPGPAAPPTDLGKRVYDDDSGGDVDGDATMTILGAISHLSRPHCPAHWSGFKNVVVVMMVMWCWQFWVPSATSPGLAAPLTDKRCFFFKLMVVVMMMMVMWWWQFWVPSATAPCPAASPTDKHFDDDDDDGDDGDDDDDDDDVMMTVLGAISNLFQPCYPAHW